ncbi:unnamed protein product, partial [Ectocarpus fasciculatus]
GRGDDRRHPREPPAEHRRPGRERPAHPCCPGRGFSPSRPAAAGGPPVGPATQREALAAWRCAGLPERARRACRGHLRRQRPLASPGPGADRADRGRPHRVLAGGPGERDGFGPAGCASSGDADPPGRAPGAQRGQPGS